MKLEDSIAESLEQRGLWHRAARRWLTVMDGSKDDVERELIARRREHCLNMAADIPPEGRRAETRRLYKARQRYKERY
ncbi:peptide chain release factor H [Pantoea ananatis]|uniref:PerC family transcriptional regulator n=1 Tax=Pantoea TaxID=53335 RepID=UPI0006CFF033|nr:MULTISPECIES: PerC family transcriptional regulator [Pantoea]KTR46874.1 peptide chain release factor H [Pantoea ananatis]KTR55744.1 peptide chain release factor H [Pantoea ananatis]KTR62065.1 peptide chain release factor H [Pantoea ananatis]KTR69427.1 peptide chain release factor H [Pantoea ananatis]